MNIVDFSEGILGFDRILPDGRQARNVVAVSLRRFGLDDLANDLEAGKRTKIERLQKIGEKRILEIKQNCW